MVMSTALREGHASCVVVGLGGWGIDGIFVPPTSRGDRLVDWLHGFVLRVLPLPSFLYRRWRFWCWRLARVGALCSHLSRLSLASMFSMESYRSCRSQSNMCIDSILHVFHSHLTGNAPSCPLPLSLPLCTVCSTLAAQ
jgi:hypothetical protein